MEVLEKNNVWVSLSGKKYVAGVQGGEPHLGSHAWPAELGPDHFCPRRGGGHVAG